MTRPDPKVILEELMRSSGLGAESRLYRATLPEFLTPTDVPGVFRLTANAAPSEAVVDVYRGGHISTAEQVGAGLAFAESAARAWEAPDRTTVSVRVQDVLDQGGLLYPVESVITERVWYCTLPGGGVPVRVPG